VGGSLFSKIELAVLDADEKTRLIGEIAQFIMELEARLNEIINRLQAPPLA